MRLFVVLGHPDYYPRFGFVPAHTIGLSCEYDVPASHFMTLSLDGAVERSGCVRYHTRRSDSCSSRRLLVAQRDGGK